MVASAAAARSGRDVAAQVPGLPRVDGRIAARRLAGPGRPRLSPTQADAGDARPRGVAAASGFAFRSRMKFAILSRPADGLTLDFPAEPLVARPSGALWAPALGALLVADLHLGRSERTARRGGALLPPYETAETLTRLEAEVAAVDPRVVVSLGDSFDDDAAAAALGAEAGARLARLAAGRRWVWIAGNHDPAPRGLPGETAATLRLGGLTLRHIGAPGAGPGEVSGHLHPKATLALRGRRIVRRCFLADRARIVLPAFGAYAGGLDACDPAFDALFPGPALALLQLAPHHLAGARRGRRCRRAAAETMTPRDPDFAARVARGFAAQGFMRLLGAALGAVAPGAVDIALPLRPELSQQHGCAQAGAASGHRRKRRGLRRPDADAAGRGRADGGAEDQPAGAGPRRAADRARPCRARRAAADRLPFGGVRARGGGRDARGARLRRLHGRAGAVAVSHGRPG